MLDRQSLDLDLHCKRVIDAFQRGEIIPFLGADINICGRPKQVNGLAKSWVKESGFPPNNQELALYLDNLSHPTFIEDIHCPISSEELPEGCPLRNKTINLLSLQQVSQYIEIEGRSDLLYGALGDLFETHYTANPVHQFLAELVVLLRNKGYFPPYPLFVTTCFDSVLEQTFDDLNQPYDMVAFVADQRGGRFEHQPPDGKSRVIDKPNEYQALTFKEYPVILKLYGRYGENFVITEDHYIDYLAHRDIAELLPATILANLHMKKILFLGYSPRFWNLRVILHRLWSEHLDKYHQW